MVLANFLFRINYEILWGKHENDRLKTSLGKFECAEKKTVWEGPAAAKNPNFKIEVAPPECPEDACPGKKCVMKKNFEKIYKPVCERKFSQYQLLNS